MELINSFFKLIIINVCVKYSYFKLLNKPKPSHTQTIFIYICIFALSGFQSIIQNYTPFIFRYFIIYFIFSLIYSKIAKVSLFNSLVIIVVSFSLSYIANFISYVLILLIEKYNIFHLRFSDTVCVLLASIINISTIYTFFAIKRFKNGFPFLLKNTENSYIDIYVLIINSIIILAYCFFGNVYSISMIYLTICFIFFAIIMFIVIQKTFILYQKQKLQLQALKDYEQELSETKQKLETAIQEKEMIVKSNHEFYHRQEALNKKLDLLMHTQADSMNTEFGKDYSDIADRLTTLSNEYNEKTSSAPNITKSNITEIDDMLTYMQSECLNNNIEFILKIDCDINHIITNFITKSQLETLLGDLIRNAIIAINHSSNTYRSIMVVFGIKDDAYELCILDSGIPFEAETLINLGINKASTHLDEGGSGIGFITTFETINSCGASFIVNEITNNNYTKSLEIKFDDRHEYIIISNRKDQLKEMNNINRDIILK